MVIILTGAVTDSTIITIGRRFKSALLHQLDQSKDSSHASKSSPDESWLITDRVVGHVS